MKKYIILGLVFTLGIGSSFAQGRMNNLFGLSWEIAIPTNNDFLDKTSFAGGKAEYRHFLKQAPVSFGIAVSWNSFEQYIPTQTITYKDGNSAITTDMDRVIYTVPVMATAHYYFNYGKKAMPYIGLGIGTQYAEQNIYYNIFEDTQNNWGFAVRPEIGVLIRPNGGNWGILLGAAYSYATNKNDLFQNDNLKSFNFNIGLFLNN
ncbi:outer membrane beta-barrel protein [Chitinophaga sp. CC14]|uniref:outer membrane beta-barrel protein n=1 Tax=Chitinophaga sp. CC14 TaxID=3029199 RepID=UPI003B7E9FAE